MIGVRHVLLVLLLNNLLLPLLLGFELLNLLLELVVLGEKGRVGLIYPRLVFLEHKKLTDDLIHGIIAGTDLWRPVLFDNLAPVHVLKLIANVALTNDALENLNSVPKLAVLCRKMEVFVLPTVHFVRHIINVAS